MFKRDHLVWLLLSATLLLIAACAPTVTERETAVSSTTPPTNLPTPTETAVPKPTSQFADLTEEELTAALFEALRADDVGIAQALIEAGVELNTAEGQANLTPIMIATIRNNAEMFTLLLEAGADATIVDDNDNNLLHHAINKNGIEIAAILLTLEGIDLEQEREQYGFTPLLTAAFEGKLEMVDLLLGAGANIEAGDDWGDTPLNVASWNGKKDIVERLLELGAEPDVTNVNGSNALDHAKSQNHEEIEALLLSILEGKG